MTILDFFFKQTPKQIKECFKNVGLDKYYDVPSNNEEFCKKFNLEDDKNVRISTIKRWSACELYVYITMSNPVFPETPIRFNIEYYIKSGKGACSISISEVFGFHEDCQYFNKVSDIFDDRDKFNNIELNVRTWQLPDVFDIHNDSYDGKTYTTLKKNKTFEDVYNSVIQYCNNIKPYINKFIESIDDGSYEATWNKYLPSEPWKRGHEIFRAFALIHFRSWMLCNNAGHNLSFDDFVILLIATSKRVLGDKSGDLICQDNEKVVNACFKAIEIYKKDYLEDTSYNDWCETYKKANQEFYDEYVNLLDTISKKYNINKDYLKYIPGWDCWKIYTGDKVPDNAYIK